MFESTQCKCKIILHRTFINAFTLKVWISFSKFIKRLHKRKTIFILNNEMVNSKFPSFNTLNLLKLFGIWIFCLYYTVRSKRLGNYHWVGEGVIYYCNCVGGWATRMLMERSVSTTICVWAGGWPNSTIY